MAVVESLHDMNLEIVTAASGREALKAVLGREFALIILDVQMPGMDGFETAALIRGRELSRETPIIFLTAVSTTDEHVRRGYSLGAVDTANQCLVPQGIAKAHWDKLSGAERFYLKLIELESRGTKTLDNYQNFAKAFKVRDFRALMGDQRANQARLKSAVEFDRAEMGEGSELYQSVLRAVLYAIMELSKNMDGTEVLAHLTMNIPDYYGDMTQRDLAVELADYLAKRLEELRPEEASAARVLRELIKNQRLG